MTVTGNQLLSALGSGILPSAIQRPESTDPNAQSFDEILAKVQRGEPSEIGIQIGKDLRPLDVSVQTRELAGRAADSAAIRGIRRAVVDVGDSVLRLDVTNRVLEAQIEHHDVGVIDQIDGYVSMRPPEQSPDGTQTHDAPPQAFPARVVRNLSLADLLSANDP